MVKFRARLNNKTVIIELNGDDKNENCLRYLKQEIATAFGIEDFEVSLNRVQPLVGDNTPLKDLGLVPGDLVHVLITHLQQDYSGTVPKEEKIASHSDSATGKCQVSSEHGALKTKEKEVTIESTPSCSHKESLMCSKEEITLSAHYDGGPQTEDMEQEPLVVNHEINKYLSEPLMIRESTQEMVPHTLQMLFEDRCPDNSHDALFLVLHLLMLETGFSLKDGGSLANCNQAGGIKKMLYETVPLTGVDQVTVTLLYITLGNTAKVYCTVENREEKSSCHLKCEDYILSIESDTCSTYKNLPKLSMIFKDKVSYPVLQWLHRDTVPNLLNLTTEIQILILQKLSALELLKLSSVCKQLRLLSNEQVLWRRQYLLQFGSCGDNTLTQDWKNLYKVKYIDRERRREELSRRHYEPDYPTPHIPPHAGVPYPTPSFFPPGAIGGDFDRDTFFAGMPAAFGGVQPMRPRPRFDPVGPLGPDQRFMRPGRGGGIWEDIGVGANASLNRHNPGGHRLGGGFGGPRLF